MPVVPLAGRGSRVRAGRRRGRGGEATPAARRGGIAAGSALPARGAWWAEVALLKAGLAVAFAKSFF